MTIASTTNRTFPHTPTLSDAEYLTYQRHQQPCGCATCLYIDDYLSRPLEVDASWELDYEDARRLAYRPSFSLRRIAERWPFFAWLCWLPPEDRAWYTAGERGRWFRENFAGILADWAWDLLVYEEVEAVA